ncbi:MAG: 5' nucleotidase, NT5C type [Candidatus Saccharimonadales bacterium]
MRRKLLAVDIDNVLADFNEAFVDYANKNWNSNITVDDITEDWAKLFGVDEVEWQRRATELFSDKSQVYRNLPLIPGVEKEMAKLGQHFDIIAITSRSRGTESATRAWLDANLPGMISEVHFSGIYDRFEDGIDSCKQTKGEICKSLNIDFFIDDEPKHCVASADHDISTIIFGEYPTNRDFNDPRIPRAKTWQEAANILLKEAE